MTTAPRFRLFARTEQAALLDLPWELPLEDRPEERLVEIGAPTAPDEKLPAL